jgi:hypothetical protein
MTRVRGISVFTETGHLRWRVTLISCRCSRPDAIATDHKVESLERIRRAFVFLDETCLIPQALSGADRAAFFPEGGEGALRARRMKP